MTTWPLSLTSTLSERSAHCSVSSFVLARHIIAHTHRGSSNESFIPSTCPCSCERFSSPCSHLLLHALPAALLPFPPALEVRRQPAHSAQREYGLVWRVPPLHREEELNFFRLPTVQQNSLISLGTTELHSDATTNQRLRRWQGKLRKLVKWEARLCQGDRHWKENSPTESLNARCDSWLVRLAQWKLHWSIVLVSECRLVQGYFSGWWNLQRIWWTGDTPVATERRRHTDCMDEGLPHWFWNLMRRFCT